MPQRGSNNAHGATGSQAKCRHLCYDECGQLCMTVVDPVTRKLLIPVTHIYETRSHQRSTLPSLCQLFLTNRCRQGGNCYQVHAAWEMVEALRGKVDALPCCCVCHGDPDRAGVRLGPAEYAEFMHIPPLLDVAGADSSVASRTSTAESGSVLVARSLRDVVLYVPDCAEPYIALEHVSYTVALKRLLEEQDPLRITTNLANTNATNTQPCRTTTVVNAITGVAEERAILDATGCTVCRLHAMDRCRYAEECKFLHLCKEVTAANPHLTRSKTSNTNTNASSTTVSGEHDNIAAEGAAATGVGNEERPSGKRGGKGLSSASAAAPRHQNHHGGVSVFTSITRQQQQQMLRQSGSASTAAAGPPSYMGMMGIPGVAAAANGLWTDSPPSYCPTSGSANASLLNMMHSTALSSNNDSAAAEASPAAPTTPRITLLVPQRERVVPIDGSVTAATAASGRKSVATAVAAPAFSSPSAHLYGTSSTPSSSSTASVTGGDDSRPVAMRPSTSSGNWVCSGNTLPMPAVANGPHARSGSLRVIVNCSLDTSAVAGSQLANSLNGAPLSATASVKTSTGRTWQHNPYSCTRIVPMTTSGALSNICGSYDGMHASQSLDSRGVNQAYGASL